MRLTKFLRPSPVRRAQGDVSPRLLSLDDALAALGSAGVMASYHTEIPLTDIVGSAGRSEEYTIDFTVRSRSRDHRTEMLWRATEWRRPLPPIDLVRLGELYFVRDGHHRVAWARSQEWTTLPARVVRICTIAYAMSCLTAADLAAKAAERRFLERVPLSEEVSRNLWLDRPADWARLADAAQSWVARRSRCGDAPSSAHEQACAWWDEEVVPVLTALREQGVGMELCDVQLYVTALTVRDRLGALEWPSGFVCRHSPSATDAR